MEKIFYYSKLLTYTKLPLLKFQDYFNFEKFKVYEKTKISYILKNHILVIKCFDIIQLFVSNKEI